jgi:uncharacterized membrane protein required for colicin V production
MVLWLTIFFSGLFVLLALKKGFYEIVILFFNILVSVYMAIFLMPWVMGFIPADVFTKYNIILAMSLIAVSTFVILYGISFVFLTSRFSVSINQIFDFLLAGLIGFMTGFLASSFIVFLICVTPFSQNDFVKRFGFDSKAQQYNISYICTLCDIVNYAAASKNNKITSREAIEKLLDYTNTQTTTEQREEPPVSQ